MDMQMGVTGNSVLQELPEGRKLGQPQAQSQSRQAKQNAGAIKKAASVLPVTAGSPNKPSEDIRKTVTDIERISLAFNKKLKFKVDHQSHEVTVKVIDPETDKVIKELPSQELQQLRDRIRETIGILFDAQI